MLRVRSRFLIFLGIPGLAVVALQAAHYGGSDEKIGGIGMAVEMAIDIPRSIQTEHKAIHSALEEATKAPGTVGAAARKLAEILHPHFVREEEIALPPLGLLAPLAAGGLPPGAAGILSLTDALKREMPRMLEEHKQIRAAVNQLRDAARAERAGDVERFAEELSLHALTEEEVLYPAAVLVGDLVRARIAAR